MRVINQSKNTVLAEEAFVANALFNRLKGLLGERGLPAHSALILKPCNSIHTFFMRFPIDAAFIDREKHIIKIYPCLKPWRLTPVFLTAVLCIELPAGTLSSTHTQEGDQIQLKS